MAIIIETKADDHSSSLVAMKAMRDSLVNIVGQVRVGTDTIATASSQIVAGNLRSIKQARWKRLPPQWMN